MKQVMFALALVAAAVGTLVASIALYVGKEVTNMSALAFIVTAVVAAIILFARVADSTGANLGQFGTVLDVVFAILLVVTGVLFARTQGSRGR